MTEKRQVYFCEACKQVVEVLYVGAPTLKCCGKDMILLEEQSQDAATEKHVPIITNETADSITVTVGSTKHPMMEKHYIALIEVHTADKVLRAELKPGDEPEATFNVKKSDVTKIREYCNIHGLWKNENL